MIKKLRQVADTVHQTVYLSELESNMISTAYFYRLHDVYQSSTVYLTFPCNRTKRYEHSCGTMELAGEMFFSAITNSTSPVLEKFFDEAELNLKIIVQKLLKVEIMPTYCSSSKALLSKCFATVNDRHIVDKTTEIIEEAYKKFNLIEDSALSHYMPPFSDCLEKRKFLYQCLLEAVRIVALFHDVGHPPYSHIMEYTLGELYSQCNNNSNNYNAEHTEELLKNLRPFKESINDNISCLLSLPVQSKAELHEQIGLKMLAGAFEDIFESELQIISKMRYVKDRSTVAVYYIAVAEFCFAILREQNPFFISLHRIIDGCVDADRMDYIVRDSYNSGVNWGRIPYKRLIESCKMIEREYKDKTYYSIAFPKKMSEHIDDLLLNRYKIFSRINYHHRSYKTALILRKLVKILAEDYLRKDDSKKTLCPGISDLWNCLSSTLNSRDLYIIQWNDSTLISHLYHTLAEIKCSDYDDYGLTEEQYKNISNMLEEFLLNRKHFHSVFKRQSDFTPIFENAFEKLSPLVDIVKKYEQEKIKKVSVSDESSDSDVSDAAEDSIKRLDTFKLEGIIKSGDADALERLFPSKCSLKTIIPDVLDEYRKNGKIGTYLFDENIKRTKTGLPQQEDLSDAIYLYESDTGEVTKYNTSILENQIVHLQNNCLQYIAYIELETVDTKIIEEIRNSIGEKLVEALEESMKEIFSCLKD